MVASRDAYYLLTPEGRIDVKHPAPGPALIAGQSYAMNATKPVKVAVIVQPMFGPQVQLYRVERDNDGVVHTTTLNPID